MIRFACICGNRFELPDEQAGDELQCPQCMRLVDVPLLGQINAFEDDGTLRIADAEPVAPALTEKIRAFAHRQDMRQTVDEYLSMDDVAPADEAPKRMAPRYDPITGELVEQIEVRSEIARTQPQDIPMARPALSYANRSTEQTQLRTQWWQLPWKLLSGPNLASLLVVFLIHCFIHFLLVMPGMIMITPVITLLIVLAIAAHYGNTIDEFGPRQQDEIPAMLRGVSFTEDIRLPLQGLILAYLFSFGPLIAFGVIEKIYGFHLQYVEWTIYVMGMAIFPAALLTGVSSGAMGDFLPHRMLSVITASIPQYTIAVVTMAGASYAYLLAIEAVQFIPFTQLANTLSGGVPYKRIILGLVKLYGLLLVAIYLMHLAAAMLGLIYRHHHERFNWIFLRFERQARHDLNARLEDMRRRGDPRLIRPKRAMPVQPLRGKSPPQG